MWAGAVIASVLWLAGAGSADPEPLLKQAIALHQQGKAEQAVPLYEDYLRQKPASVLANANLGAALASLGRYEAAVERYRKALEQAPGNQAIRLNLGLAYYKQTLLDEAIVEFQKVLAAQPSNHQAALLLADAWLNIGENQKVVDLLSPVDQRNPTDQAVSYLLGTALIRTGDIERGQVVVDRILRNGESPEALLLLASVQLAGTANKDAIGNIERALKLNPRLPGGWTVYGLARLNDGNPEGAKEAFLHELQNNPNDFESHLQVGALFRVEQNYDEARNHFEKASQLRPRSIALKYQVGALEMATGHLEQSRELLEACTREAPSFVEAHVSLATLYYRMKRKEDGDRERSIVEKLNAEVQKKELKRQ